MWRNLQNVTDTAEPDPQETTGSVLRALGEDPFQPQLHLHAVSRPLVGCHAVSVTHSYRITLILQYSEHEIILLDIGRHDDVYR